VIDEQELGGLFKDLGEPADTPFIQEMMLKYDKSGNKLINFDEFEQAMSQLLTDRHKGFMHKVGTHMRRPSLAKEATTSLLRVATNLDSDSAASAMASARGSGASPAMARGSGATSPAAINLASPKSDGGVGVDDKKIDVSLTEENPRSGDEEQEDVVVPHDLSSLPADQQLRRIKLRSAWMLTLGTVLVIVFSDPMVDVLHELGNRIRINSFYVAFVLAPVASNASEVIASYQYALKRTKATATIGFSALEGAACMNNTFCLGIFLCLVFFRDLAWEFAAETLSILLVELVMFLMTIQKTQRLYMAFLVLSLYPLSLVFVVILEAAGLN